MRRNVRKVVLFALVAACFTSSMANAFENEFHGTYTLNTFISNYESANAPGMILTGPNATLNAGPAGLPFGNTSKNLKTNNYFEQRGRIYYIAKTDADLKLMTAFEIDTVWGDRAGGSIKQATPAAGADLYTGAFRNSGAALEADAVNLETKWLYLDFKIPSTPTRLKVGIQPFKDNIKGLFADFDAAGIRSSTELGKATVSVAYFRAYDQTYFTTGQTTTRGTNDLDIGVIGAKYALNDQANVGFDYYIYNDPRGLNIPSAAADMQIHTFGLYGDTKVGKTSLSGLLAYQAGVFKPGTGQNSTLNAAAANLFAKAPLGAGTFKTAILYTTGDNDDASRGKSRSLHGWVGTNQSANANWNLATGGTNSYSDSDMMLLNRCTTNMPTTTDNHLIFNSGNGTTPINSQGQILYSLGYELPVSDDLSLKTNAGFAWVDRANVLKPINKVTGKQNESNFQGAEINLEASYKLYQNLTTKFQAAYVKLGDYYKDSWSAAVTGGNGISTPQDPYSMRILLQYVF